MRFWRGWGALGLFPLIVATLVFGMSMEMGIERRGDGPQTGAALALIALGLWWLGRRLNRGGRKNGEASHSLFMIPLQYYGIPLLALGGHLKSGQPWTLQIRPVEVMSPGLVFSTP
jgi:hypothetical protein